MENDIERKIAKNLIELRKGRNLKQSELSAEIGYSDKTISRWENGSSVPDISTLVKLAEFYNVSLEDLINENANIKSAKSQIYTKKQEVLNDVAMIVLSFLTVWLISALFYVGLELTVSTESWKAFIWAIPISSVVIQYKIKRVYYIKWLNFILLSFVILGFVVAIFIQFLNLNFWHIFLLAIPLEGMAFISSFFKIKKLRKNK